MKRWLPLLFLLLAAAAPQTQAYAPVPTLVLPKLYGPDFDGVYGWQNGTGGFEADAAVNVLTLGGKAVVAGAIKTGAKELIDAAAKTPALRNPNVYEALFEAPISGTTRAAHRTSANQFMANQLGNDAQLSGMFNQQLGGNVLQHMQSGRSGLLNPPGTAWHHPANNPNVMQLLRTSEHTAPSLQPVLHPGGVGGFGNFYGP